MSLEIYWANIVVCTHCSFSFNSELWKAINTKLNCCLFAVDTLLEKPLHSPKLSVRKYSIMACKVKRFIFGETSESDR